MTFYEINYTSSASLKMGSQVARDFPSANAFTRIATFLLALFLI